MLYVAYWIILDGNKTRKSVSEISVIYLPKLKNRISSLQWPPWRPPPNTPIGSKTRKEGFKYALQSVLHHCEWSQHENTFLQNFSFDLYRVKSCSRRFCTHQMPLNHLHAAVSNLLGGPLVWLNGASGHWVGPHWHSYCHQTIGQARPRGNRTVLEKKRDVRIYSGATKYAAQQEFRGVRRAHGIGFICLPATMWPHLLHAFSIKFVNASSRSGRAVFLFFP